MNTKLLIPAIAAVLCALPFLGLDSYQLHLIIMILIWSFVYTSWSIMGRFGLVSLGHGAFMAMGGYVTALAWNELGISPWLSVPGAMILAGALALLIGYPCFRFRITGHYFALVTLALAEVVRQVLVATRDTTGGALGYTPESHGAGGSLYALQSDDRLIFYFVALIVWIIGILIWRAVDQSMSYYALEAISEDEDASAAVGVQVTKEKLKVTVLSAMMTAFAGALYCQYQMFISPSTIGGIGLSLQIVFGVVVGGIYSTLGPTIGAVITLMLAEFLRIWMGKGVVCITEKVCLNLAGMPLFVYGIMLVLFIIFLPKGIAGACADQWLAFKSNRKLNT